MSNDNAKITIYGAEWCPPCHMTKNYLKSLGVDYKYVNVDESPEGGLKAVEISGQRGIPVIDFDGDVTVGFDRPLIDHLLKQHKLV